jgi:hypothetical protein
VDLPSILFQSLILHKWNNRKCEHRNGLWSWASPLLAARPYSAIREESSSNPAIGRWEQLIQSFHLAQH